MRLEPASAAGLILYLKEQNDPEWQRLYSRYKELVPNGSIELPDELEEGFVIADNPHLSPEANLRKKINSRCKIGAE